MTPVDFANLVAQVDRVVSFLKRTTAWAHQCQTEMLGTPTTNPLFKWNGVVFWALPLWDSRLRYGAVRAAIENLDADLKSSCVALGLPDAGLFWDGR